MSQVAGSDEGRVEVDLTARGGGVKDLEEDQREQEQERLWEAGQRVPGAVVGCHLRAQGMARG